MIKRHTVHRRQNLRHFIALSLTVLGLWVFSLTGALTGLKNTLWQLGQNPIITVASFPLPLEDTLYGLLPNSPLLSAGRAHVMARLSESPPTAILPTLPVPQPTTESPIYAQGDDDDDDTPNLPDVQGSDVVNYTARGEENGNYILASDLYVADRSKQNLIAQDIADALAAADYTLPHGAKILILHTHGTEAYTPSGKDTYTESDPYRTTDNRQNIVQIGEEMSALLRKAGFQVLHDTNLYDYPDYNSSYANSRVAAQQWLSQYPDIALILDVHRDALTNKAGDPYRLVAEDGKSAQFMMVVGSDDSQSNPNWRDNFALALQLQQQLTADWGLLCRPTTLRSSRYNQDLSTHFLLVEIGGHGNSLQDARLGAQCFTQSLITALSGQEVNP